MLWLKTKTIVKIDNGIVFVRQIVSEYMHFRTYIQQNPYMFVLLQTGIDKPRKILETNSKTDQTFLRFRSGSWRIPLLQIYNSVVVIRQDTLYIHIMRTIIESISRKL